ncbi:cytochrome c oxidase subunit VIIa polypeptide 2 like (predicted), isoform CRA_b [Rattus norvegicus]|uniref:Cytochrome c oxidase subunit VIIa polypeptide 2 like (Predicted), isoform CRA_b n=1 Tax=Rattus norvegicus TaxID=10116 RepID=A6H9M7_RAT|nr:cytochrome c oxidase subunit VIIa polypeptide 2 like (predicted), isoform CRA_b [Rattus norvegicus]EDM02732.1 cytochrome c oxidase subunit VIIa polypeptide 2 like (predicted), isoform CRA_b [Rattus norvegicus]
MLVEIICSLPLIVGQFVSKGCLPLPDLREVCLCFIMGKNTCQCCTLDSCTSNSPLIMLRLDVMIYLTAE